MWRLRVGGDHLPAVVVAPVRALVQRLGPHVEAVEPVVVARRVAGRSRRARRPARHDGLPTRVPGRGARRARGARRDRRRVPVDRRPSRCASTCGATRSTACRSSRWRISAPRSTWTTRGSFPCARSWRPKRCRRARSSCSTTQPWGAEQWERLAEGQTFDGMESWLPWLCTREHLLPDLLPPSAIVALFEPRRLRDRAQELLDEEAALGADAGEDVGRDARSGDHAAPVVAVRPPARGHEGADRSGAQRARRPGHAVAGRDRVRSGRR